VKTLPLCLGWALVKSEAPFAQLDAQRAFRAEAFEDARCAFGHRNPSPDFERATANCLRLTLATIETRPEADEGVDQEEP
jgi:hypothetical protein